MLNNNKITNDLELAVATLRAGDLVAFPTETVYGLGAAANNPVAIQKVFKAKGRPADHPVIVHISDVEQLHAWAKDIPDSAFKLAQHFWPGSLTILLKKHEHVSALISGGQDTIGIRIPNHPLTLRMLKLYNDAIVGPSANKYGRVSPTTAAHVAEDLKLENVVILDGGNAQVGIESTIIDLTTQIPTIRRLGAINAQQISAVLNQSVTINIQSNPQIRTPGCVTAHYAPRTQVLLVSATDLIPTVLQHKNISVLSWQAAPNNLANVFWQRAQADPKLYAQELYANLRQHDLLQNDLILIEKPPATDAWAAILDRLTRASA